jgi:hypothetical protein
LFVSAQFVLVDPFESFFLGVVLEFAVEAVLPVAVGIIPWSRLRGKMLDRLGLQFFLLV